MLVKNKKQRKKTGSLSIFKALVAVILVAVLVFGALAVAQFLTHKNSGEESRNDTNTAEHYDTENTDGANESKTDAKEEMEKQEQKRTQVEEDESGRKKAAVVLYYVQVNDDGTIEAMGEVNNLVEQEGSCTYIFTNGAQNFSESAKVVPNASSTICGRVNLSRTRFMSGTWKVTLRYESEQSTGVSPAVDLVIK